MPLRFPADAQVLFLTNSLGIYIHIPFCHSKCNYCSFYSLESNKAEKNIYCDKIIEQITKRGRLIARPVCSVYIGGGTPSVMGGKNIARILTEVKRSFNVACDAEITVEANPDSCDKEFLELIKAAGCNRLSVGLQSANDNELEALGRCHSSAQARAVVDYAKRLGFNNISVDLMLGLPHSTVDTLDKSLDFALALDIEHISLYILKIEQGTPFYSMNLQLPDDDSVADQYLYMCKKLQANGYEHYEISNFAKPKFRAIHNTNYWKCREYLGFGPSAHSFIDGKRFYHSADICKYMRNTEPIPDGIGGTAEEYIMLGLRISDGISNTEYIKRFDKPLPEGIFKTAQLLKTQGLCKTDNNSISLTDEGMLVSNSIINSFLGEIAYENL